MKTKKKIAKAKKAVKAKKKIIKKAVKAKKKKKNPVKKPAPVKYTPEQIFGSWWEKNAEKKVSKIERQWLKENEPNDPDEDGGGDHWCVNEMMHSGDASEMTYEIAQEVFLKGYNNEPWEMNQGESLYCDLDSVIMEAYPAGKKARK